MPELDAQSAPEKIDNRKLSFALKASGIHLAVVNHFLTAVDKRAITEFVLTDRTNSVYSLTQDIKSKIQNLVLEARKRDKNTSNSLKKNQASDTLKI
ncbi:MAG: hypothetical protein ACOYN2_06800 [Patescibacteria group bacterium]